MFLTFHFWGNGEITENLKIRSDGGEWKKGIYCPSNTENISVNLGYFHFEPSGELLDAIKCIKTVDDLEYLNIVFKIPKQKILHVDNDKTFSRSEGMKLAGSGMAFSEQLKYYNLHKNDVKKTVTYNCKTKRDVILAQLHFYISNLGYKVQICKMCGKPFCVPNLKTKYCDRIGENLHYPKYSCNNARRIERNNNCKTESSIKKNIIRTNLYQKGRIEELAEFSKNELKAFETLSKIDYEKWIDSQYHLYVPNGKM